MAKGNMSTLLITNRKNSKCSKASVAGYLMAAKGALNLDAVVGSNVSGGSVDVTSGADTNITASTVVADNAIFKTVFQFTFEIIYFFEYLSCTHI